jgi:hypothetical protein
LASTKCQNPSQLNDNKDLLTGFIFSVAKNGTILGYVADPNSEIAK